MPSIDINCDMGESFGAWTLGDDAAILPHVTSANIACGFHAGDPGTMRRTIELALANGVAVGAHPGLPDLAGFGRRTMDVTAEETFGLVAYQVGALAGIAAACGIRLRHVKAHGALYNMAGTRRDLADAIARAVKAVDASLVLFALAGTEVVRAGLDAGLRVAEEVFADRRYTAAGTLVSRREPGAVIADSRDAVRQAVRLARDGVVAALDGSEVRLRADTICVHGDTPNAATHARELRAALAVAGIEVRAP